MGQHQSLIKELRVVIKPKKPSNLRVFIPFVISVYLGRRKVAFCEYFIAPTYIDIIKIEVKRAFRRKGIGTYILDLVKLQARKLNLPIKLISKPSAVKFYLKNNFSIRDLSDSSKSVPMYWQAS